MQDTQAFPSNVDLDRAHDYYGDSLIEAINRGVRRKCLEKGLDGRRFLLVNISTQLKDQFRVTVMGRDCRYRYEISTLSFSRLCYANESKWKKVNEIGGKKVRLWRKSILRLWENIFHLFYYFILSFFFSYYKWKRSKNVHGRNKITKRRVTTDAVRSRGSDLDNLFRADYRTNIRTDIWNQCFASITAFSYQL